MKNIATNVYSFENLIGDGYIYADKTKYLYQLINNTQGSQFFLSRPRRFGKSLLLSTIQCIFEGKRELFKGLYIDSADYGWQTYPVIRLDMNCTVADNIDLFISRVNGLIKDEAQRLNLNIDFTKDPSQDFKALIIEATKKSSHNQVVLLIDEYDKPILDHLGSENVLPYQRFLKQFYGVVKSTEGLQRFCLMTGVSKFSKVSIFSDLNNLVDITMDPLSSTICGFTHEEVKHYFSEHIDALAASMQVTHDEAFAKLCKMYDGYCFDESLIRVFNPVSLGRCFSSRQLKSRWFETGTPSGLMDYLKTHPIILSNVEVNDARLGYYLPENPDMITLLFQTGFLTIKDVKGEYPNRRYTLDFPNVEVKSSFNTWLANAYFGSSDPSLPLSLSDRYIYAFNNCDMEVLRETLYQAYAAIPYELFACADEHFYHAVSYAALNSSNLDVSAQIQTNLGRIDTVIKTKDYIYIIEFKLDKSAQIALDQIHRRHYYDRYALDKRQIVLLGINFSKKERNIDDFKEELLDM